MHSLCSFLKLGIWQSLFILGSVFILTYFAHLNYIISSYWERRNSVYYPATYLFSRELPKTFLIQFSQVSKIYAYAKDNICCGFFQFRKPTLLIKSPDVINRILNTDFKIFQNKRVSGCTEGKQDPLSFHLLALNGEKWSRLRAKLTPSFTSDKLRNMFKILDNRVEAFLRELEGSSGHAVNVSELCGKLSMDCIAACAFGLELDCVGDRNTTFIAMSREAFKPGFWPLLKAHVRTLHPRLFKALRLNAYNSKVSTFFCSIVAELMRVKRQSDLKPRADFVSMLMALLDDQKNDIDNAEPQTSSRVEDLIAAQVFSFFVGGFETTSITMSNALFEIARNERVKNKLRKEIDKAIVDNEVNYENVNDLKYLSCVIDEILRLYPSVFYVQRVCSEDYNIPGTDIVIEKNMEVIIPILELHHDPQYFHDPQKFIPERFNPDKKGEIVKGTYLPFGDGPRKCIGFRFSQIELKLALCKVIREFDFHLDANTPSELSFEDYSRIYRVKHKILLKFMKRSRD